ncbi:VOC family protein [Roseomonas sp. PWR1]|uniref:VOC family protein n=1 Tax=Roseomonas nitratireducens TaxID=2820810 RepID=A0ABS4AYW3_9PROT|nr:VOC family protein [Neoroseomonas nitratireducens]MBP0466569.1 VOC family protein [Neoroseomonas nitratireducens]
MTPAPHLVSIVIPCRDLVRQRGFYERILQRQPTEARAGLVRFELGHLSLVLRARGDALFPREGDPGVMLGFRLESQDELERWHRRLLMAQVAVLEPPTAQDGGGAALHAADPEGNVLCLMAG